ncbi:type II CAAX endopeptidase family protein [Streptosporangium sp. NPDC023615]|uniref:CPBP family intramembrane glutamic endopeptidase n=1 Tax=Streptosporangium sp. NPDC023615 TaxID=3154794 RepID=UPI00342B1A2E
MLNKTSRWAPCRGTAGLVVLVTGLALIAGSALWLALTSGGEIRYTSDHAGTRPMWHVWIPVLAGLVLTWLMPSPPRAAAVSGPSAGRALHLQAGVLLASAVVFAVALRLVTGGGHAPEPAYTILKVVLLLAVPMLLFRLTGRDAVQREAVRERPDVRHRSWHRYGPAVPVAAWIVLSQIGPFAQPSGEGDRTAGLDLVTLLIVMIVVFAVNALLEEVFYRRWLQTRWEHVIGPLPAVVLASLLFAAWHIGIHGTGHLPTDLATVFVNQGAQGLFLGFLWSRYRLMWPILTVHGVLNAGSVLLDML